MRNYYFECYNEDGSLKYIPVNGICGFYKIKLDTHLDPKEIDKVEVFDRQGIPDLDLDPWSWDSRF